MKSQKNISVLIAEDMKPARDLLMDYIINCQELKLNGIAKNGQETLKELTENKYDLVFLDINFPDMSGIDVLELLEKYPHIIFTTSYDKYAIKAFEIGAIDYLLKPFSEERFNEAVNKVLLKITSKRSSKSKQNFALSFKEGGINYIIAYEEIIFLSANKRNTAIHTEDRCFETSIPIKNIEEKLPADIFHRIHRKYIINIKYIIRMEYLISGHLLLYMKYDQESTLPVGRTFAMSLKEKLGI